MRVSCHISLSCAADVPYGSSHSLDPPACTARPSPVCCRSRTFPSSCMPWWTPPCPTLGCTLCGASFSPRCATASTQCRTAATAPLPSSFGVPNPLLTLGVPRTRRPQARPRRVQPKPSNVPGAPCIEPHVPGAPLGLGHDMESWCEHDGVLGHASMTVCCTAEGDDFLASLWSQVVDQGKPPQPQYSLLAAPQA